MSLVSSSLLFPVQAVLFDLDDTLYERGPVFAAWTRLFLQKNFPGAEAAQQQTMLDLLYHLDGHGYTPRREVFTRFQSHYPDLSLPLETLLANYSLELVEIIELSEATERLFQQLVTAGIPFGVITNGQPRQQLKIERLGIDKLTDCLFISDVFGVRKPDPAIFLAAAEHLKVEPEKILFVGDHPYKDIWGAHQVGMHTAWIQRAFSWPEELPIDIVDISLQSLADLSVRLFGEDVLPELAEKNSQLAE